MYAGLYFRFSSGLAFLLLCLLFIRELLSPLLLLCAVVVIGPSGLIHGTLQSFCLRTT